MTAIDWRTVKNQNEVNLLLQKRHGAFHGIVDYTEFAAGLCDLTTIRTVPLAAPKSWPVALSDQNAGLCDNEWGYN